MNTFATDIASQEMDLPLQGSFIAEPDDRILVTGAAGFIGSRVLQCLLDRGFRNLIWPESKRLSSADRQGRESSC